MPTCCIRFADVPDPPADEAPSYREPHGCVRDLLRFLRNGFGLLPGDGLGVPFAREEAAAGARREGFGPPSSKRATIPQHRSGSRKMFDCNEFFFVPSMKHEIFADRRKGILTWIHFEHFLSALTSRQSVQYVFFVLSLTPHRCPRVRTCSYFTGGGREQKRRNNPL